MMGKTHAMIGAVSGAMVMMHTGEIIPVIVGGSLGYIGGLLPDIDHHRSMISQRLGVLALPFRIIPHRTFTHALWIPLIIGGIFYFYPYPVILSVGAGWVSHIILDMTTQRGIMPLYPVRWRIRGIFRTGGLIDNTLYLGGIVGGLVLLWGIIG